METSLVQIFKDFPTSYHLASPDSSQDECVKDDDDVILYACYQDHPNPNPNPNLSSHENTNCAAETPTNSPGTPILSISFLFFLCCLSDCFSLYNVCRLDVSVLRVWVYFTCEGVTIADDVEDMICSQYSAEV